VFATSLNGLRGLKATGAEYFAWKNEPLGCQLQYCRNSVSVGKLDSNGETLWSWQKAGVHAFTWNGNDDAGRRLPSGVYLAKIATSALSLTRTVVLAR
jgi:flagellar hook assembly protein FlgD